MKKTPIYLFRALKLGKITFNKLSTALQELSEAELRAAKVGRRLREVFVSERDNNGMD